MKQIIKINMLGDFTMKIGDLVIDESVKNSKKIWNFFEYMIYFRNRPATEEEIIELLWPGGSSNNPINSLKNILYRLRCLLKELGVPNYEDIVVYNNAKITWNSDVLCYCDYEEFERLSKIVNDADVSNEVARIAAQDAIDLYKGDFLNNRANDSWVMPINTYYRTMYINVVNRMIEICEMTQDYGTMLSVCKQAITIAGFEEKIHYGLILSQAMMGNNEAALAQYELSKETFYDKLGMDVSDEFITLYRKIIHSIRQDERDINRIKENLNNIPMEPGCMECEYEVFKSIYTLNMRENMRNQRHGYLLLCSIIDADEAENKDELTTGTKKNYTSEKEMAIKVQMVAEGIKFLRKILKKNVRTGDIFTRYSNNQYLIMLNNVYTENDLKKIIARITKRFQNKQNVNIELEIDYVSL